MAKFLEEEFNVIRSVIDNGGVYTITIDASDIPVDARTETFPGVAPNLETGFELPPSSIIHDPVVANEILTKIDTWGQIQVLVYKRGGKIFYKKLPDGRYEATIERAKDTA
ncbi:MULTISPECIES: hypothetical protein [Rhizobium]|uniref:Uncharacterized protein n=2 Tax=Rhizobium TaxID=379 RepID=A0A7W8XVA9_9HYPH|nr:MULTISPECIES: hypothetical protein [Rhizobium]ENN83692.1 hypothetical protein RHSP_74409 [Rhizobium freirei PRF 81]MBB5576226.1 hypothetical protein [Rhizobium paranaense]MDK4741743.1 hypothetical protein [Rhizobium sp. CNPSo 3464]